MKLSGTIPVPINFFENEFTFRKAQGIIGSILAAVEVTVARRNLIKVVESAASVKIALIIKDPEAATNRKDFTKMDGSGGVVPVEFIFSAFGGA